MSSEFKYEDFFAAPVPEVAKWVKVVWSDHYECWVLIVSKLDTRFEIEHVGDYSDTFRDSTEGEQVKAIVIYNPSEMISAVKPQVSLIIHDATEFARLLMIASFGLAKSGRPGRFRQASAPGEPPAIQSGNLFRKLLTSYPNWYTGELVADTPYARILEEGINRPFFKPAIEKMIDRVNSGQVGSFA